MDQNFSVTLAVSWFVAIRFTLLKKKKWSYLVVYLFFIMNILEAVVLDVAEGNYTNYINAAAGVLLIITMPGVRSITVDEESPHRDLAWNTP